MKKTVFVHGVVHGKGESKNGPYDFCSVYIQEKLETFQSEKATFRQAGFKLNQKNISQENAEILLKRSDFPIECEVEYDINLSTDKVYLKSLTPLERK